MKNLAARLWTGIVGAMAGGCIGLLAGVVLASLRVDLNVLLLVIAILAGVGFVLGVALGNRKLRGGPAR